MEKFKMKCISFLWYLGTVLELVTIPLCLGALKDVTITYDWYKTLSQYENIEMVYYIVAAITMGVFSLLVIINKKRKKVEEMFAALLCFSIQVVALAVVLITLL